MLVLDEVLRLCFIVYIQANLEDDIVKEALKTVKLSVGLYFLSKKVDLNSINSNRFRNLIRYL